MADVHRLLSREDPSGPPSLLPPCAEGLKSSLLESEAQPSGAQRAAAVFAAAPLPTQPRRVRAAQRQGRRGSRRHTASSCVHSLPTVHEVVPSSTGRQACVFLEVLLESQAECGRCSAAALRRRSSLSGRCALRSVMAGSGSDEVSGGAAAARGTEATSLARPAEAAPPLRRPWRAVRWSIACPAPALGRLIRRSFRVRRVSLAPARRKAEMS